MSQVEAKAGPPRLLWTLPLFETVPLAPVWIWLIVVGSWMVLFVASVYLTGGAHALESGTFWLTGGLASVQAALLVGYLPAAILWAQRGAVRTLLALRPALRFSEVDFEDRLRGIHTFDGRKLLGVGVFAVGSASIFFLFVTSPLLSELPGDPLYRLELSAEQGARLHRAVVVWLGLVHLVGWWLLCVFFYTVGTVGRRLSHIGEASTQIDLVDLEPLRPFAEWSLGRVLSVMVLALLVSFGLFVFPNPRDPVGVAPVDIPLIVVFVVALPAAAVAALLWPMRGVHRRLQSEKRTELERIRAEIRTAKQPGSVREGRLADLIAYEGRIESVNTWLLDRSALLRFGLFLGAGRTASPAEK